MSRPSRWVPTPLVLAAVLGACSHPAAEPSWKVTFGPVLSKGPVAGRVARGETVWLATRDNALVRVDLSRRTSVQRSVHPLQPGERIWGLASAGGDSLWTLVGEQTLAEIATDGTILRRIALNGMYVGLFGTGRELLFQRLDYNAPADTLLAGRPGDSVLRPWGGLITRVMPLARAIAASLNLVGCGASVTGELPCWFPDQAVVAVTDPAGLSRQLTLEGVSRVEPESLLGTTNPRRPIRDVFISADGDLWVLASGVRLPGDETKPGGRMLIRSSAGGRMLARSDLPEPARLVLFARVNLAVLLTWDGRVVEVRL